VTAGRSPAFGPVAWLTAQATLFGATAALLGIVANAMFLEAYGSGWLPVTYIVIGVAGVAISAAIRRGAERLDLLRLAVGVLGGAAGLLALSWVVAARPGGSWVSGPLLVLFPILIQLGFVFIGGQAGRVLDIAGIKASFPRIMAGFPVGAVLGGLAAVPLVDLFGRVEDLLLVTALAQGGFAVLVRATGRRYVRLLRLPDIAPGFEGDAIRERDGRSIRRLLGQPFIALVLAYQVLSALGSQLADFLVFDRASALYSTAEELGRFVAAYTAVMNGVAIAFLFAFAGPLLRRFGLQLGIGANPAVGFALSVASLAVLVLAGPASFGLLAIVSAARIADIALTDGMTRTSINALYQVLPTRQRLVVQATVEGMGVPLAIGVSGVLLLVLDVLPEALAVRIVMLAMVCIAWTWVARRVYRAYGPELGAALRARRLLDPEAALEATPSDATAVGRLLADPDPRAARLGRELAAGLSASSSAIRLELAGPAIRAFATRDEPGVAKLLDDPAPEVRSAALDAVEEGDAFALEPARRALEHPATASAAAAAIGRLGDVAVPALEAALSAPEAGRSRAVARLVRAARTSAARDAVLARHVEHPDRSLGLAVMERLAGPGAASAALAATLDKVVRADVEHAAATLEASVAIAAEPALDTDRSVRSALDDELRLAVRRVVAALAARHGRDEVGAALRHLSGDQRNGAIAAEALEVTLGRDRARLVQALLDPTLGTEDRLARLRSTPPSGEHRGGGEWLVELAGDPDGRWRSSWLQACAVRALRLAGLATPDVAPAHAADDPVVAEELALIRGRGAGP
jgi:hypothetical protein